jgi:hypothetical protein
MEQYGIVTLKKQKSYGCGGMTQYPVHSSFDSASFMDPEEYNALSEPVFGKTVNWSDISERSSPDNTLTNVKKALNSHDRVVFGFLIPRTDLGTAGAVGKYKTLFQNDSWVLTPEIIKGVPQVQAGHEMIITGYDDNAVAVDNHKVKHKGLLILRNSWGRSVGNSGDFYMSYDYFKLLSSDVTRLSPN